MNLVCVVKRETETDMETEIDRLTDSNRERQLVPSHISPTPLSPPTGQSALLLVLSQVSVSKRERQNQTWRQRDRDKQTVTERDSWCHHASLLHRFLLQLDSQRGYS